MRSLILASALILYVTPLIAQEPARPLSAHAQRGEQLYFQRCSVCHLSTAPKYQTYGPPLHQEVIAARGDDAVRQKVMEGSQTMPGWKYTLKPADVDDIIVYLKTVTKAEVTHKGSNQDQKTFDD